MRVALLLAAAGLLLPSGPGAARAQDGELPAIRLMETVFGTLDGESLKLLWQF